ncbi:ATP-binding protein [Salinibacillus xinjiangensis]|nr:ATP-binding protein [Salinibacillus xinjiangensis]
MGLTIQSLLSNVLCIIFPLLCYLLFFNEEDTTRTSKIFSKFFLFITISLFLTLTFPAHYTEHFTYDLRLIPILLAFLYGTYKQGILTIAIMLLHTFIFAPADFSQYLGNYTVIALILFFLTNYYRNASHYKKFLTLTIFYFIITSTRAFYLLIILEETNQLSLLMMLSFITWFTIVSVMLLMENMDKQIWMKRELQHIEKMDAVSQLAATVTHEVKNPLTTVKGFLQILRDKSYIEDKDKEYIKISIEELVRAEYMIQNYLSLSKPNSRKYEVIDLSNLLKDLASIMATYAIKTKVHVITSIKDDLQISGFKYEVQQVLLNVFKNAVESMENGGELRVWAEEKEQFVEVTIKDEGKGISKEDLKKIGTPYFTTKKKGTGLGLSVSFEIVKRMGGNIQIESEVGKGTTMTVQFPIDV